MDEQEFFSEELESSEDFTVDYDDYPEFDLIEYTTDW